MARRRLPDTPEQEALRARWREAKRRQRARARESAPPRPASPARPGPSPEQAEQRRRWREAKRRQRARARLLAALLASAWALLDAAADYIADARADIADGQGESAMASLEEAGPLLVAAAVDADELEAAGADEEGAEVRERGRELADEVLDLAAEAAALVEALGERASWRAMVEADEEGPSRPELVQLNGGAFTVDASGDSWLASQQIVDKCNEPGLKTLLDLDVLYIRASFETEARELLDVRIPCSVIRQGPAAVQAWIESAEIRLEAYLSEVAADGYEEY